MAPKRVEKKHRTVRGIVAQSGLQRLLTNASSSLGRSNSEEALGQERDEVLRTFGELFEGLDARRLGYGERLYLQKRIDRRLNLAKLFFCPEGFTFSNVVIGRETKKVKLRSPPNLVALQDDDGGWYRAPRDEVWHGPAEYSAEEYAAWLAENGLPRWFLSSAHIRMNDCSDEEAKALEEVKKSSTSAATPTQDPAAQARAHREQLIDAAESNKGFVNPGSMMQGLGRYEWLDPELDQADAVSRGFYTAAAVTLARSQGRLLLGTGPNSGPGVVFYPRREFLNPQQCPLGPGHFEFLTLGADSMYTAEGLAALNFGGQAERGFEGIDRPSASQIWGARQWYWERMEDGEEGVPDLTEEIDLVWIPDPVESLLEQVEKAGEESE